MNWIEVITIVGSNIVLILGMLGTYIALYLHSDTKMNNNIKAIQDEMKDFHEKLIRLEERRMKLLERS